MSECVLDASALLAVMLGEPGSERILELLPGARIGAVNLAEVVGKLQERGVPDTAIERSIAEIGLPVIPLDEAQAIAAGKLRARTRKLGLSLGDRTCLALALECSLPAVTTDRSWSDLGWGPQVILARD